MDWRRDIFSLVSSAMETGILNRGNGLAGESKKGSLDEGVDDSWKCFLRKLHQWSSDFSVTVGFV